MSELAMPVKSSLRQVVERENERRVARGEEVLTQQQIAYESKIAISILSGLITNRVKRADFHTLARLCKYFDVQPGDLLTYSPDEEE